MLCYDNAMELRRRPWQRRIEVYSPKIQRRLTLFSRDAHDAWLLLEADPEVRTFCERPAYVAGEAGRLIDFWVDRGRHAKFWILGDGKDEDARLHATLHGVAVRIIHRADMIAAEMRVKNGSQIIPYLISFKRHANRRLQEEIFARVEKPHRLEHLEAAFQPIDVSLVRASLFKVVAEGRVVAPDIDLVPLGSTTIFRRPAVVWKWYGRLPLQS